MLSCTKSTAPDCVKALGKIKTETRILDDFHRLEVQGRIDLNLVQDSTDWVEVTFGESLLDGVITKQTDGVLRITEQNKCDWVRDQRILPLVTVHYKKLRNIYSESAGTIQFINAHAKGDLTFEVYDVSGEVSIQFEGDSLNIIAHTGATNISAIGWANAAYYYNASYAPFHMAELKSKVSTPHSASTGDIELFASEAVYYQIFDWGNIIVHGNPPLIQKWHDEGTGELIVVNK